VSVFDPFSPSFLHPSKELDPEMPLSARQPTKTSSRLRLSQIKLNVRSLALAFGLEVVPALTLQSQSYFWLSPPLPKQTGQHRNQGSNAFCFCMLFAFPSKCVEVEQGEIHHSAFHFAELILDIFQSSVVLFSCVCSAISTSLLLSLFSHLKVATLKVLLIPSITKA
jgi:hypothetical protein